MSREEKKQSAERLYVNGNMTLRTLAEEMDVSYAAMKRWSREGKWSGKRRQKKSAASPQDEKKKKAMSSLQMASNDLEEALQMAASGIKRKMAEDSEGTEITDGKYRAGNLKSIAYAIGQQTRTRMMQSGKKNGKEKKTAEKTTKTPVIRLEEEVKEISE